MIPIILQSLMLVLPDITNGREGQVKLVKLLFRVLRILNVLSECALLCATCVLTVLLVLLTGIVLNSWVRRDLVVEVEAVMVVIGVLESLRSFSEDDILQG